MWIFLVLSFGERFVRSVELVEPDLARCDLLVGTIYGGVHGPLKTLQCLNAWCVIDIAHSIVRSVTGQYLSNGRDARDTR